MEVEVSNLPSDEAADGQDDDQARPVVDCGPAELLRCLPVVVTPAHHTHQCQLCSIVERTWVGTLIPVWNAVIPFWNINVPNRYRNLILKIKTYLQNSI